MSQTSMSPVTFDAEEALKAYRRVKLGTLGTQVVYADAGEAFIGVTAAAAAINDSVAVHLRGHTRTFKMVAGEAMSAKATIYGAVDGKVKDTAGGHDIIGTALEAAAADGDVIECLLDYGAGSSIDGENTAIANLITEGGIPVVFGKAGITDANASDVTIATPTFKCKIIDWWVISRDTTAANIKLKVNAGSDITANVAKGTADDVIVPGGTIVAETDELAAAASVDVEASAAAAFDIFFLAVAIA